MKQRILALFHEELAEDIATLAQPVAVDVLKSNYAEVEREIRERLAIYKNPLQLARDAIVTSHTDSARRRDAQRRGRVLERIEEILAELPAGKS